ncbi:MAG: hypothetical protein ACRENE_13190, partial [Polyangiaceae bacterium]
MPGMEPTDPTVAAPGKGALAQAARQALAVYAEEFLQRGVVAVLGDATAGIGELALRLGARAVHVWDPDVDRALAAAGSPAVGLSVWPLVRPREDLTRRDFDVAIVSELGLFRDPAGILAEVRRMVGQEGVAIVMARNPESERASAGDAAPSLSAGHARSFDYYELFDAVAAEFDFVRMVAQLPFRGVALVELGDGEGEGRDPGAGVSVDTQLVEENGDAPDAFVAVASQRDVSLDPYAIVQVPGREGADAGAGPGASPGARPDAAAALAAATEALSATESRASAAETALSTTAATAAAEIARLESTLAERTTQVAAFAHELDEARASAEASRLSAAEELDELISRLDRAERKAVELAAALAAALAAQASAQSEANHPDSSGAEHELLEQTLRERARVIRELEVEVARRDRLVRDLAGALEEAHDDSPGGPPAGVSSDDSGNGAAMAARLDEMALDLARRESAAQAAAWENEELQRRLAIAERAAAAPPATPGIDDPSRPARL